MNQRFLSLVAVCLVGMGGVLAGWYSFSDSESNHAQPDAATRILFEQPFKNSADQPMNLSQYQGSVVVVNFWATWCAPCIKEMPELSALQDELGTEQVQFIGLAVDSADNVRSFSKRIAVSYPLPVLGAAGIELARQFGNEVGSLPFTVVINGNGIIVDRTTGIVTPEHLRRVIVEANDTTKQQTKR